MPSAAIVRRIFRAWSPALAMAAVVLASKALALGLLAPRLASARAMADAWRDPTLPGEFHPGAPDPETLVARHRPSADAALAARLDALARRLGQPEGAPTAPLEMLRTLAERDLLIPPACSCPNLREKPPSNAASRGMGTCA